MLTGRAAYDDGMLRITRTGRPAVLAIAGEINEYTHAGLVRTLSKITPRHREIHITLRDVTSCELPGLRAIVLLTRASCEDHEAVATRNLVLHEVPPQLRTVLQILGWDGTPGLTIQEPGHNCSLAPRAAKDRRGRVPPALRVLPLMPSNHLRMDDLVPVAPVRRLRGDGQRMPHRRDEPQRDRRGDQHR